MKKILKTILIQLVTRKGVKIYLNVTFYIKLLNIAQKELSRLNKTKGISYNFTSKNGALL